MKYYVNRCEVVNNISQDLETGFLEFEAENDGAAIKKFKNIFEGIELKKDQFLELARDEDTPQGEMIHIIAIADENGIEKSDLII